MSVFKIKPVNMGGNHYHINFFAAKNWKEIFSHLGTLVMSAEEYDTFVNIVINDQRVKIEAK